jgi:hypothetical protein
MRSFAFISLFLISFSLLSQTTFPRAQQVFGPDPLLYNGEKYTYFLPSSAKGHQFLETPEFTAGKVIIRGETFTQQLINYDVYNQQLLLKYEDPRGAVNIIELSKAWLESFTMRGKEFLCLDYDDDAMLCQVLGEGGTRFLYHWRKEFKVEQATGQGVHSFSTAKKSTFLMSAGRIMPLRGNRSLLKLMGPEDRISLKNHLRHNKIRIRNASDSEMEALANYISQIVE